MDDDVTELAALRRRAYGPDADIGSDRAAMERLVVLEDAARGAVAPAASMAAPGASTIAPGAPTASSGDMPLDDTPSDTAAPVPSTARRRPRWHTGMVIGVAVAALTLAAVGSGTRSAAPDAAATAAPDPFGTASPFHADPAARILAQVPTDGTLEPLGRPVPPSFPVPEDLLWSSMLGEHYGWELWLARSSSGLPCIALRAGQDVRARCVLPSHFDEGSLVVTVPYDAVRPADRPDGMNATQSLGFEWLSDSSVSVVIGEVATTGRP